MITGVHLIAYAQDAEKARAFFKDVLGLKSVDGNGLREGRVSKELWKSVEKSKALDTPARSPRCSGQAG